MMRQNQNLMRVLRPKITPDAAVRMHMQYMTGAAVTTMTLGMLWWGAYWETWARVMYPEGRK
jgi:hypothetical protein